MELRHATLILSGSRSLATPRAPRIGTTSTRPSAGKARRHGGRGRGADRGQGLGQLAQQAPKQHPGPKDQHEHARVGLAPQCPGRDTADDHPAQPEPAPTRHGRTLAFRGGS
jgi:hypothetical protein